MKHRWSGLAARLLAGAIAVGLWASAGAAQAAARDVAIDTPGNFGNDVLYYIVLDRFADGDPGNNIPEYAFAPAEGDDSDTRAQKAMNRLLVRHTYDPTHRYMSMYWGGDLAGVIQQLDYLQDLGVTKLVVSPIQDNANGIFYHPDIDNYLRLSRAEKADNDDFYRHVSTPYHGYWTRDWFEIDEHFRAPDVPPEQRFEVFRQLLDEAGKRDIGIVLDLTMNQTSPGHISTERPNLDEDNFLFGESWFADNGNVYRHGELVGKHWDPETGELNPDGWFHPPAIIWDFDTASEKLIEEGQISGGMPDLDQTAAQVEQYFFDATRFWLTFNEDSYPIAGFRLDAVKHVNIAFWKKFESLVHEINPEAVLLGEFFGGGYRYEPSVRFLNRTQYITHYDFNLSEAARRFFLRDRGWDGRAYILRENNLGRDGTYYNFTTVQRWWHDLFNPAGTLEIPPESLDIVPDDEAKGWVTFVENHDEPRLPTFYSDFRDRDYQSLIEFQFVARGVPLIMYGAETALGVPHHPDHAGLFGIGGDPFNRPMMVWPGSSGWKQDVFETTRRMAHLRQEHPVLRYGSTRFLRPAGASEMEDLFMIREPVPEVGAVDPVRVVFAYSTHGGTFQLPIADLGVAQCERVETGEALPVAADGTVSLALEPGVSQVLVLQ